MLRSSIVRVALVAFLCPPVMAKPPTAVPAAVGSCVSTSIREITGRLMGAPDSGDAVVYANGIYGVSYDTVPELRRSRVGDPIELCLTAVPNGCPPGDERGSIYLARNLRTGEAWALPDAQHMCGGA